MSYGEEICHVNNFNFGNLRLKYSFPVRRLGAIDTRYSLVLGEGGNWGLAS